jgi:two-component system, OmpR family, response regulator AdeR
LLTSQQILIAEDDVEIADILRAFLQRAGARTRVVHDGEAALEQVRSFRPDLLLLDLRMPKKDGFAVLVAVRDFVPDLPVMLITALGDDVDRLSGFRLGADDYIVKPFNPHEVVARAAAVLRRTQRNSDAREPKYGIDSSARIVLGDLRVEADARLAYLQDVVLKLTPTEYRILLVLARRPGRMFGRSELCEVVLSDEALDRGIDAHVSRLRAKLGAWSQAKINAVRGEGYRLDLIS